MSEAIHTRDGGFDEEIYEAVTALEFNRSLAVVIGINNYDYETNGIRPLKTASPDAVKVAELLITAHDYDVILFAGETETKTLFPKLNAEQKKRLNWKGEASLGALNTLLEETLIQEVSEAGTDRILFYFAGHGLVLEDAKGEDGPVGYLIPQDAEKGEVESYLPMIGLNKALVGLQKCHHLLLILDCCFGGAIRWSVMRDMEVPPQEITEARYQMYIESPAWQAITSAAHDEKAADLIDNRGETDEEADEEAYKHSPFALALFKALNGEADTFPPAQDGRAAGDGLLTATELHQYIFANVQQLAKDKVKKPQRPGLWPLKNHHSGEYVFYTAQSLRLKKAAELTAKNNPYRGLQPFDETHQDLFFGRQQAVAELVECVTDDKNPLTVVLGASGAGKSSLVKAGLLPRLRLAKDRSWHIMLLPPARSKDADSDQTPSLASPMRPTNAPLQVLANVVQASLSPANGSLGLSSLINKKDPEALARLIQQSTEAQRGDTLLLVIDQFEEMVTQCRDDTERQYVYRLLTQSLAAAEEKAIDLRIVLTLRSDFEPRFARLPELSRFWKDQDKDTVRYVVQPMDREELREAIVKPAGERALYFKPPQLVEQILDDVAQMPGTLPLLSFTLSTLYLRYLVQHSKDRALTEADYNAIGKVIGALGTRADDIYKDFGNEGSKHQATLERIVNQLQTASGPLSCRKLLSNDEEEEKREDENQRVETVLEAMREAGLVTLSAETVELNPDWQAQHQAVQQQVGREGPRHLDTMRRVMLRMLSLEGGHLARRQVSWADFQAPTPAAEALSRNELYYAEAAENRRVARIIDRLVKERLLVTDQANNGIYVEPAHDALINSWQRIKRWLDQEPDGSLLLHRRVTNAAQDWISAPAQTEAEQTPALTDRLRGVWDKLTIDPKEGQANRLWHNSVYLPQVEDVIEDAPYQNKPWLQRNFRGLVDYFFPRPLLPKNPYWLNALESSFINLSLNKRRRAHRIAALIILNIFLGLATATGYALIQQNRAEEQTRIAEANEERAIAERDIALSRLLVAQSNDELTNGNYELALLLAIEANAVTETTVDFDPIRATFAYPWRTETILFGHEENVQQATWSPDETRILTTSRDGTARIWKPSTGSELFRLQYPIDMIEQAVWSANGTQILTRSNDGSLGIWDAANGDKMKTFDVCFKGNTWSSDRSQLLVCNDDGTYSVWDINSGEKLPIGTWEEFSWSPEGHKLMAISGTVAIVVDAATGEFSTAIGDYPSIAYRPIWSPDESRIMLHSLGNPMIYIWDIVNQEKSLFGLEEHTGLIMHAIWSPDGSRFLTQEYDGRGGHVWDALTGDELGSFEGISHHWGADESHLLVDVPFFSSKLINVDNGKQLAILEGDVVGWSTDRSRVLTQDSGGTIYIWDSTTGRDLGVLRGHTGKVNQATWSEDGSRILTSSEDGTARVWRHVDQDNMSGTELPTFENIAGGVTKAIWSADSAHILIEGFHDRARIWNAGNAGDANPPKSLVTLNDYPESVVAWKVYEDQILTLGETHIRAWNASTGEELHSTEDILDWSPDRSRVLVRSNDGTLSIWDATKVEELVAFNGSTKNVEKAVWSSDGVWVLTSNDGAAHIWDTSNSQKLLAFEDYTGGLKQAVWNTNNSRILIYSNNNIASIWDATTGKKLVTMKGNAPIANINKATWTVDDTVILIRSDDGASNIWDASTGTELSVPNEVIDWSDDGSRILTRNDNGIGTIWDPATNEKLVALSENIDGVKFATWSDDRNRIFIINDDDTFVVWDGITGAKVFAREGIHSFYWSPDRSRVLINAYDDKTAYIWDATTGKNPVSLEDYRGRVTRTRWNDDETLILIGSEDGTVRIWDVNKGEELVSFIGHTREIRQVTWSPDGARILTGSDDGTVRQYFTQIADLIDAACQQAVRNLSWNEWRKFVGDSGSYRPTCPGALIPPDAIEGVSSEIRELTEAGDFPAAVTRLEKLLDWLQENGQYNMYGEERELWLDALQAGENPFEN